MHQNFREASIMDTLQRSDQWCKVERTDSWKLFHHLLDGETLTVAVPTLPSVEMKQPVP